MLSSKKFKNLCRENGVSPGQIAEQIVRAGMTKRQALAAVKNWQNGLFKTAPTKEDIRKIASVLGVSESELGSWHSTYKYAPGSPRKARLVTEMIMGRQVQEAIDLLKFTPKRASSMIDKVLKTAIADADESQADVEKLVICEARVDDAGIRLGTKRWRAKDRGRAHSIKKKACHIHVTVTQA